MAGMYLPRHPEKTVLYQVLFHYFEEFVGSGLINLELVRKILLWHHTGFNVHSKVRAKSRES